jgi:hypothetical protein
MRIQRLRSIAGRRPDGAARRSRPVEGECKGNAKPARVTKKRLATRLTFAYPYRMRDGPAYCYPPKGGHCAYCGEPFGGNRTTAFMARASIVVALIGLYPRQFPIARRGFVPVCDACVTPGEMLAATREITCKGCGLAMRAPERKAGRPDLTTCSDRCAQRVRRLRRRQKRRTCATCGLQFKTTRSDARFCGAACKQKAFRRRAAAVSARPSPAEPSAPG